MIFNNFNSKGMKELSDLLKSYTPPKSKITNERQYLVSLFVEEINKERPCSYKVGGKKKTLGLITPRAVAMKLGHIPTNDLYYILSTAKDYKNRHGSFSKFFFGSIK